MKVRTQQWKTAKILMPVPAPPPQRHSGIDVSSRNASATSLLGEATISSRIDFLMTSDVRPGIPQHRSKTRLGQFEHIVGQLKAQSASGRKTPSSHSKAMAIIPAAITAIIQSPLPIVNFLTAFFLPLPGE
jgi:hypothetical protein